MTKRKQKKPPAGKKVPCQRRIGLSLIFELKSPCDDIAVLPECPSELAADYYGVAAVLGVGDPLA